MGLKSYKFEVTKIETFKSEIDKIQIIFKMTNPKSQIFFSQYRGDWRLEEFEDREKIFQLSLQDSILLFWSSWSQESIPGLVSGVLAGQVSEMWKVKRNEGIMNFEWWMMRGDEWEYKFLVTDYACLEMSLFIFYQKN
jgi:hypothetical protein